MAKSLFDEILASAMRKGIVGQEMMGSIAWFQKKVRGMDVSPEDLQKEKARLYNTFQYGRMYSFFYDPKLKKSLTYYDRFPLVFPTDRRPGGFLGINLHYLPPKLRAVLMDGLYGFINNTKFNQTTKLQMSYQLLKSAAGTSYFMPCVKYYLKEHITSRFIRIEASEWNSALFLPTERFEKASTTKVWKDSRAKLT